MIKLILYCFENLEKCIAVQKDEANATIVLKI